MNFWLCEREKVNNFIPISLIEKEVEGWGVERIDISWAPYEFVKKGEIMKVFWGAYGKDLFIYINRKIDPTEAAEYLSRKIGFKIYPHEVYLLSFLLEFGRLYKEGLLIFAAKLGLQIDQLDAEQFPYKFAAKEFFQWRRQRAQQIIN